MSRPCAVPLFIAPPSAPPAPAAVHRADKRCPKCGLEWFATRDVGGDLACIYCGWVEYQRPAADPEIPGPDWPKDRLCAVEGCDRFAAYGGLCAMHDHRKRRHGDPLWESAGKAPGGEA